MSCRLLTCASLAPYFWSMVVTMSFPWSQKSLPWLRLPEAVGVLIQRSVVSLQCTGQQNDRWDRGLTVGRQPGRFNKAYLGGRKKPFFELANRMPISGDQASSVEVEQSLGRRNKGTFLLSTWLSVIPKEEEAMRPICSTQCWKLWPITSGALVVGPWWRILSQLGHALFGECTMCHRF